MSTFEHGLVQDDGILYSMLIFKLHVGVPFRRSGGLVGHNSHPINGATFFEVLAQFFHSCAVIDLQNQWKKGVRIQHITRLVDDLNVHFLRILILNPHQR